MQVRLRSSVPWQRPHAQEGSSSHRFLGAPYVALVDRGLGYRRGDSSLQQSSELSCTLIRLFRASAIYQTDINYRPLSSQAGSLVCTAKISPKPLKHPILTKEIDGLSATFWLYLNKDRLFATPMKIFLTIVNVLIFAIAGCIVCSSHVIPTVLPVPR